MYSGGLEYESWVQSGYTEISLRLPSHHQIIPRTNLNPTKFSVSVPHLGYYRLLPLCLRNVTQG
jgi:hypothetical protein